jgi:hypothetical protein
MEGYKVVKGLSKLICVGILEQKNNSRFGRVVMIRIMQK